MFKEEDMRGANKHSISIMGASKSSSIKTKSEDF